MIEQTLAEAPHIDAVLIELRQHGLGSLKQENMPFGVHSHSRGLSFYPVSRELKEIRGDPVSQLRNGLGRW